LKWNLLKIIDNISNLLATFSIILSSVPPKLFPTIQPHVPNVTKYDAILNLLPAKKKLSNKTNQNCVVNIITCHKNSPKNPRKKIIKKQFFMKIENYFSSFSLQFPHQASCTHICLIACLSCFSMNSSSNIQSSLYSHNKCKQFSMFLLVLLTIYWLYALRVPKMRLLGWAFIEGPTYCLDLFSRNEFYLCDRGWYLREISGGWQNGCIS